MASIIARFTTGDGEYSTAIGSLFLSRRSRPTQPVRTAQWPCFALVVQGEKSLGLGPELYRYGVGDYLVVSLDLPVASRVTQASAGRPHLGLGMAIVPKALKEALGRIDPARPAIAPDAMRGVAVNAAPHDLLDASLRLLRLLDRPEDIAAMAPLIEQEILYRLLSGRFGQHLLQMAMADTVSNRIARATAWLRENFARPLRIEALAEHAGMSASSLHHQFKAVTAMTPMQYQKQLRLHEARRLMMIEKMDVGTAGYRVGYQSPSQFSREYRRLYGLPPLRDVAAANASLAAE
ncbi:AraC family transcriptional regulator [Mesorhizobium sp. PAMC28654]|uniref:AraC family transcriptional regulator n=1 Tax=Mesorhizobium sp. PAMC28654 TaxID=2880934 RepID=UPI001D0B75DF|nr:AraC family transcriptional regulator [Mesorhizobium sp. PAMC28654]UDL92746.1 AraC family transcriptional regulator [Mesorhizobium sp. PAMC28654]